MFKLLDFYSDRCPPCQMLKPILEEVAGDFGDRIEFEKVNVDEDPERAAEFGIMSIPTLVILKNEQEIDRKVGFLRKEELSSWLESHLGD